MRAMKTLNAAGLAIATLLGASATTSAQENPFDAVFAIMTQPSAPASPGCRGCHIGEAPFIDPYFGNTQDEVENTLITFGDGELILGGRDSLLAGLIRDGVMPYGGTPWTDDQLQALYVWLDSVTASSP